MKNISTIIGVVLLAYVAYKAIKRYAMVPKMKFQSEQLVLLDKNETTSIEAYKGHVLLVSCYQTWCGSCARETPDLNELAAKINSPNFTVLYISDEAEEKANKFRQRFASENIVYAKSAKRFGELGIRSFPSNFLINKKGEVVMTKLEGFDWLGEEAAIKKLLAE